MQCPGLPPLDDHGHHFKGLCEAGIVVGNRWLSFECPSLLKKQEKPYIALWCTLALYGASMLSVKKHRIEH
jgi:hypothetical protein